jgi:hypothetical protein
MSIPDHLRVNIVEAIMPYEAYYQTQRRVIYTRLAGNLSLEDVKNLNDADTGLLRAGTNSVHIIFDTTQLNQMNIDLRRMEQAIQFAREPQLGWVIIIGSNPIARYLGSIVMRTGRANFRFVETMGEALMALSRIDPSLK